jgi:SAM-dependent methyltransferase
MFKLARAHNWLIFSVINPNLEKRLKQYAHGDLIDIGCGEKPYEEMAAPYVQKHVGVDHDDTFHDKSSIDLLGTAYQIPVEDNSFDSLLCTDVLEHLEEPGEALSESFRVLKGGGYAIYTVPLFWHVHEAPRDFFRYTKFGLKYLFEKNGFEVVEIKALTGFAVTFCQALVYVLYRHRRGGMINPLWWIVPIVGHIIQGFGYMLKDGFECYGYVSRIHSRLRKVWIYLAF